MSQYCFALEKTIRFEAKPSCNYRNCSHFGSSDTVRQVSDCCVYMQPSVLHLLMQLGETI